MHEKAAIAQHGAEENPINQTAPKSIIM